MKIFVVGGSSRDEESCSNVVVDCISNFSLKNISTWKLAKKPLPLARHEWHKNPSLSQDENVIGFAQEIAKSEIIVIVSPIYNGSYTAHIKNALDCMEGSAFFGKTVVLVSIGSDSTAILPALHLQDVARTMGGFVYPRFTVVSQGQIDIEKRLIDQDISERLEEIIRSAVNSRKEGEK